MDQWKGDRLFCVDPWSNPPGYEEQAKYLWGGGDRQADFVQAIEAVRPYGPRVSLIRKLSHEYAERVKLETLDFVYLDGDHRKEYVSQDLNLWWHRLKRGGVIAGHDIVCPGENVKDDWGKEIQPAVFEFAEARHLTVYLIVEEECLPWSYYIIKP